VGAFADKITAASLEFEAKTKTVFTAVVAELYRSVVFGSELTGAPGQPVDTGYLRASWLVSFGKMPEFTLSGRGAKADASWSQAGATMAPAVPVEFQPTAFITTNAIYAEVIEDGITRVSIGNGRVAKRRIVFTPHKRIDDGSQIGGPHSFKLTIAGFKTIVAAAAGGR
jgi:hypothetical protein